VRSSIQNPNGLPLVFNTNKKNICLDISDVAGGLPQKYEMIKNYMAEEFL
jgi:hypothetical protein